MSNYIEIESPDMTILDRISEADAAMWMAAKLKQLREKLRCHNLQCSADYRTYRPNGYFDVSWTMHGLDKVALTHRTIESAAKELEQELLDNPKRRAAEAKRKAQELLKEAAELEAISR